MCLENTCESIRLSLFIELQPFIKSKGCQVPSFYLFDSSIVPDNLDAVDIYEWATICTPHILHEMQNMQTNQILAHPCPLDEKSREDLSFAGVYTSYKPLKRKTKSENISDGIVKVLCSRNNRFQNYYYNRHQISGQRRIKILFTSVIENCCMFGTAYTNGNVCLFSYFDNPLSISLRDSVSVLATKKSKLYGFQKDLVDCIFFIQEKVKKALDVEFIITREEKVVITQVRLISNAHLHNWNNVSEYTWARIENVGPPSNIINTVARISGYAVDLRHRNPSEEDFITTDGVIYFINHKHKQSGISSLEFLILCCEKNLSNIAVVIDHNEAISNDHLQYVIAEDPAITFFGNTACLHKNNYSGELEIHSDGFNIVIYEKSL